MNHIFTANVYVMYIYAWQFGYIIGSQMKELNNYDSINYDYFNYLKLLCKLYKM